MDTSYSTLYCLALPRCQCGLSASVYPNAMKSPRRCGCRSSFYLSICLLLKCYSIGSHILFANAFSSISQRSIQIWDNILTAQQCDQLHQLAVEHQNRVADDSYIFQCQSQSQAAMLTPLESAIESILREIDPDELNSASDTVVVEYWTRQEYLNMDVHSDIDEEKLERDSILRYPEYGHVLYLQAESQDTIFSPTCIFPGKSGGWRERIKEEDNDNGEAHEETLLVSVPVVPGRLLRFPGSTMHAVPKPINRWFYSIEDQQEFDVMDEYGDEPGIQRSVILFNVWKLEGPKDVSLLDDDYYNSRLSALPDGISLEETNDNLNEILEKGVTVDETPKFQQRQEWNRDYGQNFELVQCKQKREWKEVPIFVNSGRSDDFSVDYPTNFGSHPLRIPLMGKQNRRLYPKRYANLQGDQVAIQRALMHPTMPHLSTLLKE